MELLKQTQINKKTLRPEGSRKKDLFPKERHPHLAKYYKEQWSFIADLHARDNISYQMQYIEFLTSLYNDYDLYLTAESLLAKTMMIEIASVVEAAIKDIMAQWAKKANINISSKIFDELIDMARDSNMIDDNMQKLFHELRIMRNAVHLTGIQARECYLYKIEAVNEYLKALDKFRLETSRIDY